MENGKKPITPNEINKFTYCPYQWYYERYYGKTLLRQLSTEKKQIQKPIKKPVQRTTIRNFAAGNRYHAEIHQRYKKNQFYIRILFFLFLAAFCILLFQWKMGFLFS